jgi:hypothetical protein
MTTDYLVYTHTRLDTNQVFYIGKGKVGRIRQTSNRNKYWQNIVKKCNGFKSDILAGNLTEKEALSFEILMIKKLRESGLKLCNLTNGGDGTSGLKHSAETRALFSKQRKGRPSPTKGIKFSAERIEFMRQVHLGRKQSEEWKQNAAKAKIGRNVSKETREKIANSHRGKKLSIERYYCSLKPVICLTTKEWFISIAEASRKFNIPSTNISRCCKGIFKQIGGHNFIYAPNITTV